MRPADRRQDGHGLWPDRADARSHGRAPRGRAAHRVRGAGRRACTASTGRGRASPTSKDGEAHELACDFIAGCDGFHGVCRASVPPGALTEYEKVYPFGWLGLLVGHAARLARAHLHQQPARLRAVLHAQPHPQPLLPAGAADREGRELVRTRRSGRSCASASTIRGARRWSPGPSIEKSIAPLRSFVAEPLRFGRLFLAGDAGHIVPPTGAKGLNLAATDVKYLAGALRRALPRAERRRPRRLFRALPAPRLAGRALLVVVHLAHCTGSPRTGRSAAKLQDAELDYLFHSEHAARTLAENYVGLPLDFGEARPAPRAAREEATRDHRRARPLHHGAQGAGGVAQPPDRRHHRPVGHAPRRRAGDHRRRDPRDDREQPAARR